MRSSDGFWTDTITTERLCERYRLLSERRRLAAELGRLAARIASVEPARARAWERRRAQAEATLHQAPNRASLDELWRDQRTLTALLAAASRDWLELGAP